MNRHFNSACLYRADTFTADYTQQSANARGVCILEQHPGDIECFHLQNPNGVEYWGVNFEKHPAFFKGTENCECMFAASKASRKGWVCLVELKYCLEKNVASNSGDAFRQLRQTRLHLINKRVLDPACHRIYLNISIPGHGGHEPFQAFLAMQDDALASLEEEGVHILGYNQVLILTYGHLEVPRQEI